MPPPRAWWWCLALLALAFSPLVIGNCLDLSGEWRNTKGSILKIEQRTHHLHGTFSSAVEIRKGSAGMGASHLRGFVHKEMVSFSVKYPESMAAFTGQCYEDNNGTETIHVSWLLHSKQTSCEDDWMSTRTGQDKFVRNTRGAKKLSDRNT